jgi:hypothetical protein
VSSAQGDYFVFNQEVIMTGKLSKYLLALAGCQELILGSLREISPHYRVQATLYFLCSWYSELSRQAVMAGM